MAKDVLSWLAAGATPARVFAASLVLRLLDALLVRTYAAPDEHWQAPELAHKLVFGVGYVCVVSHSVVVPARTSAKGTQMPRTGAMRLKPFRARPPHTVAAPLTPAPAGRGSGGPPRSCGPPSTRSYSRRHCGCCARRCVCAGTKRADTSAIARHSAGLAAAQAHS